MLSGHGGNIYEVARHHGCSPQEIIDMSSNINPLGPPPGLLQHLKDDITKSTRLPEVDSGETIRRFADYLDIDSDRILAGNGTTQFIYTIPQALGAKRALVLGPTYSDYADACNLHHIPSSVLIAAESSSFRLDFSHLEKKIGGADTVFLCNPNNPTGVHIAVADLKRLCKQYPKIRFVIDESYLPFVKDGETQSMLKSGLKNVIVLLSISKIFAIPGLRIGFMVAPSDLIAKFKRYLLPWSVNSLAQAAVYFLTAQGSLIRNFVNETREFIEIQRKDFNEAFKSVNSIKLYPSKTPFFLARLPNSISAESAWNFLANDRILIRNCCNFPGLSNQFIRISLKTPLANRRLVDKLLELVDRSANINFDSKRKRTAGL